MNRFSDHEGVFRASILRSKKIIDDNYPHGSVVATKGAIFDYMKGLMAKAVDVTVQQGVCTEMEREAIEAEMMELIRGIIDEVFAEEGK